MTFASVDVVDLVVGFFISWGAGAIFGYVFQWGVSLFKDALND